MKGCSGSGGRWVSRRVRPAGEESGKLDAGKAHDEPSRVLQITINGSECRRLRKMCRSHSAAAVPGAPTPHHLVDAVKGPHGCIDARTNQSKPLLFRVPHSEHRGGAVGGGVYQVGCHESPQRRIKAKNLAVELFCNVPSKQTRVGACDQCVGLRGASQAVSHEIEAVQDDFESPRYFATVPRCEEGQVRKACKPVEPNYSAVAVEGCMSAMSAHGHEIVGHAQLGHGGEACAKALAGKKVVGVAAGKLDTAI